MRPRNRLCPPILVVSRSRSVRRIFLFYRESKCTPGEGSRTWNKGKPLHDRMMQSDWRLICRAHSSESAGLILVRRKGNCEMCCSKETKVSQRAPNEAVPRCHGMK